MHAYSRPVPQTPLAPLAPNETIDVAGLDRRAFDLWCADRRQEDRSRHNHERNLRVRRRAARGRTRYKKGKNYAAAARICLVFKVHYYEISAYETVFTANVISNRISSYSNGVRRTEAMTVWSIF